MPRAAGYVRRSANDDGTSVSLDVQRAAIATKAKELGLDYDPATDLYDEGSGVSGATLPHARPAMSALLLSLDDYATVIVYHQDRVSRAGLVWETVIQAVRDADTDLVATAHHLDIGTPEGRMQAGVMSSQSNYFREVIAVKSTEAHKIRAERGYFRGGPVPFGWTLEPVEGEGGKARRRLAPDPVEAPILREAVDRLIAGESSRAIAIDFNDRGISQRNGGLWHSRHLTRNLRHPRMRGWAVHHGEAMRDEAGRPIEVHEPMVGARTWRRLQERLDVQSGLGATGRQTTTRRNTYLLTGLIRCAECGSPMHGSGAGKRLSYVCSQRSRLGDQACPGVSFQVDALEEVVDAEVTQRLVDVAEQEPGRLHGLGTADEEDPELGAVEAQIERTRSAMENLMADRRAGVYDGADDLYRQEFQALTADRTRLLGKRDGLTAARPGLDDLRDILTGTLVPSNVDADAAAAVWALTMALDREEPSKYRQALRGLVARIEVSKGAGQRGSRDLPARAARVRVVYHGPLDGIVGNAAESMRRTVEQGAAAASLLVDPEVAPGQPFPWDATKG